MKEIIDISICGIHFFMDRDAYAILDGYLNKLNNKYDHRGAEGKEIVGDIEARIAELILSKQNDIKTPVTMNTIKEIIDTMGMPTDDTDEGCEGQEDINPSQNIPKRFYRNKDGARLGGVLNGLATYFCFDVTALRIAYVLLLILSVSIFHGNVTSFLTILIIIYFGLWIIVPVALTPRQKLEMTGGKITVSSIENIIQNEMNIKAVNPKNSKTASIFANLIFSIGRILKFIVNTIIAVFSVFISVAVILAVIIGVYMIFNTEELMSVLTPYNNTIVAIVSSMSVIVPLIFFLMLFAKMLFKFKIIPLVYIIFVVAWIGLWTCSGVGIVKTVVDNNTRASVTESIPLAKDQDTIYIKCMSGIDYNIPAYNLNSYDFGFDKNYILVKNRLVIRQKDKDDKNKGLYAEVERSSSGSSKFMASENASKLDVQYNVVGDTLFVNPYSVVNSDMRFHAQESRINIWYSKQTRVFILSDMLNFTNLWDRDSKYFIYNKDTGYYEIKL